MRYIALIISALLLTAPVALAQDSDIYQGRLVINQSAELDSLLYKNTTQQPQTQQSVTSSGFRVQIYSSNRNQIAKKGAFSAEKEFTETFPDIRAYISYLAPFWKVRVGDFSTYYEALAFSNKVKDTFPERATEVFVVKEDNIKPIYFNAANAEQQVP